MVLTSKQVVSNVEPLSKFCIAIKKKTAYACKILLSDQVEQGAKTAKGVTEDVEMSKLKTFETN